MFLGYILWLLATMCLFWVDCERFVGFDVGNFWSLFVLLCLGVLFCLRVWFCFWFCLLSVRTLLCALCYVLFDTSGFKCCCGVVLLVTLELLFCFTCSLMIASWNAE